MKRIRPAKLTIRARLTLVYGGLFLFAGLLLLGVTYVLVSHQLPQAKGGERVLSAPSANSASGQPAPPPQPIVGNAAVAPPYGSQLIVQKAVRETRNDALNSLLTQGGIALAVVGAAAIAFGWLIAGRMLRPLHRVTETARRIANATTADRGLHERIALDGPPDEVKELADTFDVMLERLDNSFDSQRRFIANASHELRTPLTLNRTLLEVALDPETVSPEVRQLGRTLLEINARHGRLIDGLLLLARSEHEVLDRSYVDLADIVEHVAQQVPPGAVTVEVASDEAPTSGDPVLLERLVQNLVENGVRHNLPEHGWVRVTSGAGPNNTVTLRVSNSGPVVPRYDIPSLFEPFRRLGADRLAASSGAGLGLSIVRAVAHAHGGDVTAEPRDEGGLVVTVALPAAEL
ncbi:cell wall metabolism sensor histidine kinase WalK [Micromonospora sp. KC723]|uniref:sensor histidine kinase n=1 Tax=Micromonospora sp. KC723 TaxID=2530381 RepID=UPI001052BAAE|nr:ATP-binding protein [Micromonospora sp. KC723]TDB73229.1 HAMP domain-containing protein [Micromonospora sp. KC723]